MVWGKPMLNWGLRLEVQLKNISQLWRSICETKVAWKLKESIETIPNVGYRLGNTVY